MIIYGSLLRQPTPELERYLAFITTSLEKKKIYLEKNRYRMSEQMQAALQAEIDNGESRKIETIEILASRNHYIV